jgi:hypothetical protein
LVLYVESEHVAAYVAAKGTAAESGNSSKKRKGEEKEERDDGTRTR